MSFDARELDYELPDSLIAQTPLAERDASRLLCLSQVGGEVGGDPGAAAIRHAHVRELPELLSPALLVLNDTRVIPARLLGHKPSGGKVELLLVERTQVLEPGRERWVCMGKASKALGEGTEVRFGDGALVATVLGREQAGLTVELRAPEGVHAAVARLGRLPLPPYIRRDPDAEDAERYQTVFAAREGAVAAPTAGLHFTRQLLQRLRDAGHETATVTLHVGPGTFKPLRADDLAHHAMHPERYEIPESTAEAIARARAEGRTVLAVGTTVVRTLEAAADDRGRLRPGPGATDLFIYPPHRFRVIDAMLTNFHLPRSTLLALVMAFGGVQRVRAAYAEAVARGYRFYSYGDAMLLGGLR
ncbi:MAG: tRNA preQ1(34) S-adenosylmethionine ribosyltransferase-isomerase QueA [Myxococcales bacterium]|jgi:S-adenosylmethionine:tRNA ribosyltransferase-isomerase